MTGTHTVEYVATFHTPSKTLLFWQARDRSTGIKCEDEIAAADMLRKLIDEGRALPQTLAVG